MTYSVQMVHSYMVDGPDGLPVLYAQALKTAFLSVEDANLAGNLEAQRLRHMGDHAFFNIFDGDGDPVDHRGRKLQ